MNCNRKFVCKSYVVFVAALILLVIGMLGWISSARLETFHQYHLNISHEALKGIETQVSLYIAEKNRMVSLFAEEQIDLIRALAHNPDDDELHDEFGDILTKYFPNRFAFSIADNAGIPRFEDFNGLISEMCLSDLIQFSTIEHNYHPYIHPNSEGYHFDIMVRYGKNGEEGIFFVSFLADVLGDIINSIQSPDHKIMLILPQGKDLIEIIAKGARYHWVRDDYRLSEKERALISMRHDVSGTRWQAVDFHKMGLHTSYKNKLIAESSLIFLVFLSIALLLVTRLIREERQRELAQEQKKALMAVVSHEFRSPASVIKSALDLVADGDAGNISTNVKKYIDMASSNTSRLLLLVDDFLDIQKMESGSLKLNKHETELRNVVRDSVARNKLYAEQFSVSYELKLPLANDRVCCDKHRIEQVLTNFLSNAAKYGADNDNIEVIVVRKSNKLRISVSDHGPGIPKDFQSHVFESFAMAHAPKKTQNNDQTIKSSGLGLSIAKAIIEQHGGKIGFDTKTDAQTETGTTFWFELPIV